jgi:hypothetical protein
VNSLIASGTLKLICPIFKGPAVAPAIPLETLIPLLTEHYLDPRAARVLERGENVQRVRFRCHQIFYVHDFIDSRSQVPISISALAARFGCGQDCLKKALAHGLESPETRHRHLAMSDDSEREIVSWAQTNAAKNKAVTPRDLREHIITHDNLPTTQRWVHSFMRRHLDEFCKAKSVPQEAQRREVPRGFLDETIPCINEFVNGLPTELVFDLDEVGISELEHRTSKA